MRPFSTALITYANALRSARRKPLPPSSALTEDPKAACRSVGRDDVRLVLNFISSFNIRPHRAARQVALRRSTNIHAVHLAASGVLPANEA